MITEDDLVFLASEDFRINGFYVLCRAASQTSRFCITLPSSKRKYPDLVVAKNGCLYVFECKIKFSGLFHSKADTEDKSDAECMLFLQADSGSKLNLIDEANRLLNSLQYPCVDRVQAGLIALSATIPEKQRVDGSLLFGTFNVAQTDLVFSTPL